MTSAALHTNWQLCNFAWNWLHDLQQLLITQISSDRKASLFIARARFGLKGSSRLRAPTTQPFLRNARPDFPIVQNNRSTNSTSVCVTWSQILNTHHFFASEINKFGNRNSTQRGNWEPFSSSKDSRPRSSSTRLFSQLFKRFLKTPTYNYPPHRR